MNFVNKVTNFILSIFRGRQNKIEPPMIKRADSSFIQLISSDSLRLILSHLNGKELMIVTRVNKQWLRVASDVKTWKFIIGNKHPESNNLTHQWSHRQQILLSTVRSRMDQVTNQRTALTDMITKILDSMFGSPHQDTITRYFFFIILLTVCFLVVGFSFPNLEIDEMTFILSLWAAAMVTYHSIVAIHLVAAIKKRLFFYHQEYYILDRLFKWREYRPGIRLSDPISRINRFRLTIVDIIFNLSLWASFTLPFLTGHLYYLRNLYQVTHLTIASPLIVLLVIYLLVMIAITAEYNYTNQNHLSDLRCQTIGGRFTGFLLIKIKDLLRRKVAWLITPLLSLSLLLTCLKLDNLAIFSWIYPIIPLVLLNILNLIKALYLVDLKGIKTEFCLLLFYLIVVIKLEIIPEFPRLILMLPCYPIAYQLIKSSARMIGSTF